MIPFRRRRQATQTPQPAPTPSGRDGFAWLPEPPSLFRRKQKLAGEAGARYYGDGGTIHGTTHLDVEVDPDGKVVAVWFRCQVLPYRVFHRTATDRYGEEDLTPGQLTGVEIRDPK